MKFALAGNPNCGKTTLFNALTGSTAHVGNWPGVTVDKRQGVYKKLAEKVDIIDLPGIYSLSPYTPEEVVSRTYLLQDRPDCIINVVDATNLERNLYLTTQLLETDIPLVIALNMTDVLKKRGESCDTELLSSKLNVPVVEISALKGTNIAKLMQVAYEQAKVKRQGSSVLLNSSMGNLLQKTVSLYDSQSSDKFFHAVKLIEGDSYEVDTNPQLHIAVQQSKKDFDSKAFGGDFEGVVADCRYKYIAKHLSNAFVGNNSINRTYTASDKADRVLTHRIWGIPLFLVIIFAVFHLVFSSDLLGLNAIFGVSTVNSKASATFFQTIGEATYESEDGSDLILYGQSGDSYIQVAQYSDGDFIAPVKGYDTLYTLVDGQYVVYDMPSAGIPSLGVWLQSWMGVLTDEVIIGNINTAMQNGGAADWAISLVCDGLLTGLSAVMSFLPQVMLLFLFISILEDSGYMARVAFIMDRAFRKFGLSGKAFMPLLMCFGCGIPGVMATKTLENEKERRMTMMVAPFMSCGAKLPIWLAFAGVMFAGQFGGLVVFSVYLAGIVMAVLGAIFLKHTVLKGATPPFVMELPSYHLPSFGNLMAHLWEKLKHYIFKAATIIAASIIVIWFLQSFSFAFWKGLVQDTGDSMLGSIGKVLQYLFYPLGFAIGQDGWKYVVASLTGLIAKENVVATLATLGGGADQLIAALSAPQAYAFMFFNLLSIPCMAMVAAVSGEMSKRRYTWQAIGFWMGTAYIVSMLTYWIGELFVVAWWGGLLLLLTIAAVIATVLILRKKRRCCCGQTC